MKTNKQEKMKSNTENVKEQAPLAENGALQNDENPSQASGCVPRSCSAVHNGNEEQDSSTLNNTELKPVRIHQGDDQVVLSPKTKDEAASTVQGMMIAWNLDPLTDFPNFQEKKAISQSFELRILVKPLQ